MTLEKLQLIATAAVPSKYKTRWLKWWNIKSSIRKDLAFPETLTDLVLSKWLNKAAFWAGLEEMAQAQLPDYYDLAGGIDTSVSFQSFEDYVDTWRIALWEKGFASYFQGEGYTKGTQFKDVHDSLNMAKRLCLRLVHLIPLMHFLVEVV
jgi:hypothetical protein